MNATKSAPSAWTSSGRCGADCDASITVSAPTAFARATIRATGLTVPSAFDWWTNATTFVRSVMISSMAESTRRPSSSIGSHRNVAPVRWHSSCHGTMLLWCSISVTTISSPGPMRNRSAPGNVVAFEIA